MHRIFSVFHFNPPVVHALRNVNGIKEFIKGAFNYFQRSYVEIVIRSKNLNGLEGYLLTPLFRFMKNLSIPKLCLRLCLRVRSGISMACSS